MSAVSLFCRAGVGPLSKADLAPLDFRSFLARWQINALLGSLDRQELKKHLKIMTNVVPAGGSPVLGRKYDLGELGVWKLETEGLLGTVVFPRELSKKERWTRHVARCSLT
jgi:hypothetical protein